MEKVFIIILIFIGLFILYYVFVKKRKDNRLIEQNTIDLKNYIAEKTSLENEQNQQNQIQQKKILEEQEKEKQKELLLKDNPNIVADLNFDETRESVELGTNSPYAWINDS